MQWYQFFAEYQEHTTKRRERIPGPLWVFWAPDPKDIFRWRIQLDCGCVEERIKHSLRGGDDDDKPSSGIATASDFNPLSREWLPPGEFLCSGKHRKRAQPIRDVGDWGERQVREFPADPVARQRCGPTSLMYGLSSDTPSHTNLRSVKPCVFAVTSRTSSPMLIGNPRTARPTPRLNGLRKCGPKTLIYRVLAEQAD
jgi:hypothetical protein